MNFNSRPSARGDRKSGGLESVYNISIHAPPRGATRWAQHVGVDGQISIHAPPRGATKLQVTQIHSKNISIHAPPRGATKAMNMKKRFLNFNSRPSARGDHRQTPLFRRRRISIHAPPRGATGVMYRMMCICDYFNSRPSARGDEKREGLKASTTFQFTPLREGRRARKARRHATARFQFTPLREGRPNRRDAHPAVPTFQFTPLREGRRFPHLRGQAGAHFNSRPSARGDAMRGDSGTSDDISIHAPPRGATRTGTYCYYRNAFQFTPLREGRRDVADTVAFRWISIHAPPRGATPRVVRRQGRRKYFNSRPSARGDDFAFIWLRERHLISIHAPPRGATL